MNNIRRIGTRFSKFGFAAAIALTLCAGPSAATQLTPGASVEIEAELTAKPLAFRTYRSTGDIPVPGGVGPNGLRRFGADDFIAPLPPRFQPRLQPQLSAAPADNPRWPRLEPQWPRIDPGTIACITRYPSFNAVTGTYAGADGRVRRCPFLP